MTILDEVQGFQCDNGNIHKNWEKHLVFSAECEEIFFNQPLVVADDEKHSGAEKRFFALGKSREHRRLFVVFTIRKKSIRVISARDMSKKELAIYEKREKINS